MKCLDEWVGEHKVDEIECVVADLSGIPRGKILPAAKFLRMAREQSLRMPESVFIQTVTGEYAEDEDEEIVGPQDHDITLMPDEDTIRVVPWYADPTAQIIHDCFYADGSPVEIASRHVLRRVLQLYDERGWPPVVAPEVEF